MPYVGTLLHLQRPVRADKSVIFYRTHLPLEPTSFVQSLCEAATDKTVAYGRTRFTKRLTPVTLLGNASEEGLIAVAKKVLAPHFHDVPVTAKKFAIRPTIRNHSKPLNRDNVITNVATLVGQPHTVDLKQWDLLILVEVFKVNDSQS